jgi:hypothetical protein
MVSYVETTVTIDGVKLKKQIERPSSVDRFIVADKIQSRLRFKLSSASNCVNGKGKGTK